MYYQIWLGIDCVITTVKDSIKYYLSPPSSSGEYEITAITTTLSLVGVFERKESVGVYASKRSALLTAAHLNITLIEFGE